jgi:ubiquinone/menaquinone biosynthesis C-methylase UbiE
MIMRFIAGKLRSPTGFFGRLVGYMMVKGNVAEQGWTISLLNIQPDDYILEIGFGPGVAIQTSAQKAVKGHISGIDYSNTMLQVARKRNAEAIRSGLVDLRQGEVLSLPYADASVDKAFTIHCIYFWAKPVEALQEVRRVLKAGGLLAVTIKPKENWLKERLPPPDLFMLYSGVEVAQLLSNAGFGDVHVESYPQPDKFPGECVLGIK